MKEKVDEGGLYLEFIDPEVRQKYLADVRATLEWVDGEGEEAPIEAY